MIPPAPCPFTVELDGEPLELPRGADLSSLGVNFFCVARSAMGNLHVGGLRSSGGAPVDTGSLARRLPRGSTLRIRYLGMQPSAVPLDPAHVDLALKELRGGFEQVRIRRLAMQPGAMPSPPRVERSLKEALEEFDRLRSQIESADPSARGAQRPPDSGRPSRKLIEVGIDGRTEKIAAALRDTAQLQASAFWAAGKCTFRVASVFVEPDGCTSGEQFIDFHVVPGQEMLLTYVL